MLKISLTNISLRHYLPLFFLLCLSGNPLITSLPYFKLILAVYAVLFIAFTATVMMKGQLRKSLLNYLILLVGFIILLVILRQLVLGFVSYQGVLGFILNILLALFTLLYYKNKDINFFDIYIKILAFLSFVSIPFWLLNQAGFFGIDLFGIGRKSFFLYTSFPHSGANFMIRNAGMFWEPGAFAGYLILGLIFIAWQNGRFNIGRYKKEALFITIGILTTMSTTGYVVFAVILSLYFIRGLKWSKLIIIPIAFMIGYWGYFNLPFLQKKIIQQYTSAKHLKVGEASNTRFGTIVLDWKYIISRPFIGNGLNKKTRYRFNPRLKVKGFGNGMSDFMADWGILLFLWWAYCIYRFTKKRTGSDFLACSTLLLIILALQGEAFLNFPLFLIFFTLPFV